MIGALEGVLQEKRPTHVLINVAGVGYEVAIPLSTFYELPEEQNQVSLRIHTHVREDSFQLFGFRSAEERSIFGELIRVNGIGPKLALSILSGLAPDALVRAVGDADFGALQAIPGVGKKTAQRIVIDLRDRLSKVLDGDSVESGGSPSGIDAEISAKRDEAISALGNLGYAEKIARQAIDAAIEADGGEDLEIGSLLRRALRSLVR